MLKIMEDEEKIFRSWLKKYVKKDKQITATALASELGLSKATLSAYYTGRIVNNERKFTRIPYSVRQKILEVTGVSYEEMMAVGRKELNPVPDKFKEYEKRLKEVEIRISKTDPPNDIEKQKIKKNRAHHDKINEFDDQERALSINTKLVDIEKINPKLLKEIDEYLEFKLNKLLGNQEDSQSNGTEGE